MGIKPRFSNADVRQMFAVKLQRIEQVILNRLILVGETFVRNARLNGSYLDQTGNLRSSIGYIVLKNGRTVHENYEEAQSGTDKSKGVQSAKQFISELKSNFTNGYTLIVVAGMDYAAAVESLGKDVLTSSGKQAEIDLRFALKEISRKVKKL